jgi:hypothetical protein
MPSSLYSQTSSISKSTSLPLHLTFHQIHWKENHYSLLHLLLAILILSPLLFLFLSFLFHFHQFLKAKPLIHHSTITPCVWCFSLYSYSSLIFNFCKSNASHFVHIHLWSSISANSIYVFVILKPNILHKIALVEEVEIK